MTKPIPFGKYYLLDRINVGGMAEVFKGKAFGVEGFERLVAVKRILPNIAEDEEFITMFIDEAKIAVQLQHANIAQIFDLGKVDDSYFIALEYVHGRDLRAIFDHLNRAEAFMPMAQACFIVMQVCEGLDYAHNKRDAQGRELNLVHRDVSPQNVLIGYEGEIKLVDFGIAKAAGKASKTQAGILKGKFGYMSPEQVRGLPVDRRSDIFALGIVLYELLTGERLFIGESDFSTLEKVRNVEILPPSSFNKKIPAELERIALKALAKDVEDRYQNAIDLHDDLQAFLYSVGEFYSRKDLSAWMKKTFADELAEENAKLEQYQNIDRVEATPTPAPRRGGSGVGAAGDRKGSGLKAVGSGPLEWDDEELETQIFDKASEDEGQLSGAELESGDIELQEDHSVELTGDDKTVAGAPPAELLHEAEMGNNRAAARSGAMGGGSTPMGGRPTGSGPPPGISAFRHQTPAFTDGYGVAHTRPFDGAGSGGASPGQRPYDASAGGMHAGFDPGRSPAYRQTITGMPAPNAMTSSSMGIPDRRPLEHLAAQRRSRAPFMLLLLALVAGGGAFAYRYLTRPGRLILAVKPADAVVTLDGQPIRGNPPFTIEKKAGSYQLSIERDGYVRRDDNVDIEAGSEARRDIELEPSPDTGFELTSEPPGGLVWLDGQPFTSGEVNAQQARTNFKAYRVAPGRHVIEIKGDNTYEAWKQEFFQEPGKTLKLHAELKAKVPAEKERGGSARASAAATAAAAAAAGGGTSLPAAGSGASSAPAPTPSAPAPTAAKTVEPPRPPSTTPPTPASATAGSAPAGADPTAAAPPPAPAATRPRPPRPAATRPATPRPAPVRGGEDIFEQETKLGSGAAAALGSTGGAAAGAAGGDCIISVNSKPWSEVHLDGKNTGKVTPLVDFKVPCGRHRLRFYNPDLKLEKTENVNLRAGEKFKRVYSLVDTGE